MITSQECGDHLELASSSTVKWERLQVKAIFLLQLTPYYTPAMPPVVQGPFYFILFVYWLCFCQLMQYWEKGPTLIFIINVFLSHRAVPYQVLLEAKVNTEACIRARPIAV